MASRESEPTDRPLIDRTLGYLNFSSGTAEPTFLAHLNELFVQHRGEGEPTWRRVVAALERELPLLSRRSATFANVGQSRAVLALLRDGLLPAYLAFHADLLFHQTEEVLFGPFFVGRACEVILQQGPPWAERDRIVQQALTKLNDYVGHRPVATLETRRHEPYAHEWVRPVPLYVDGAGVESGRYAAVVEQAMAILRDTDEDLLRAAHFDPGRVDELAFDPRAYDFDHPVNKRPNYHFGQWDPHQIDQRGYFRRFVIQQVTLDALMARVDEAPSGLEQEWQYEAAAVLAGTILMASGVSGSGPDTHDSTVTLGNLVPIVAGYRDAFYERLIGRAAPAHRRRLQQEAQSRRQPFGGARQHLNAWLARRRASQLEHVQLARIFARMGHAEAAARQAVVVPVASARMRCQIDCRLTAGQQAVVQGQLAPSLQWAEEIIDLLNRAIECGALIDPWNLLGFDAQFSLFPALENSVHDHRADELVGLMEQVFGYFSQIWSAAAADDQREICRAVRRRFQETANWWRQFAAHEVSSVDAVDAAEVFEAAEHVAESLHLWHRGGAAAGDVKFWAPHAHMFDSPKAFSLVVEALLERDDFVASMALLIHWLSQADRVPLEQGASSFYQLTLQWLLKLLHSAAQGMAGAAAEANSPPRLVGKFLDYLEANAGPYWNVPTFTLAVSPPREEGQTRDGAVHPDAEPVDDEEERGLYSAAYEGVVYADSTDDGVDGEVFDTSDTTADELQSESQRISDRLAFHSALARLWKLTAVSPQLWNGSEEASQAGGADRRATTQEWVRHAITTYHQLIDLLETVGRYRIPASGADPDALLQYDRRRGVKDALLDRIAATCVDVSTAGQTMLAALASPADQDPRDGITSSAEFGEEAVIMVQVIAAVLGGDNRQVIQLWPALEHTLADKELLYVPLSKEGDGRQIVAVRSRQGQLQDLLAWLPRRGLWAETCRLIEIARHMEQNNPVGPGAVTEFDELFKVGYRSLVDSLVTSAQSWGTDKTNVPRARALVAALEELTEVVLPSWLNHARTLRLSVLERINDADKWKALVAFIQRYGGDLFTQRFFNLGNLRAILHQGVGHWLRRLEEELGGESSVRLLRELDSKIARREAEEHLTLVLEAIVENYGEYRDYNSTTTQSDRGEMLYTLLDFLRLRAQYDRVCWHLKPVVLAHEILVSKGETKAARLWRLALTDRIQDEAEQYLRRLHKLQRQHAIQLSTVADRLAERFVRPMAIDRMRALIRPAMQEAEQEGARPTFELLELETQALAGEATGIGFDVPVWLLALEEEVERAREPTHRHNYEQEIAVAVPCIPLSRDQVRRTLRACARS